MDKWKIIHSYRRNAEAGKLDPLICPFSKCASPLVSSIDEENDEQPMLKCYSCKTDFRLEDDFFLKMENFVDLVQ